MITFAERLLYIRNKRGYTQKKLAMLCGLSQSTIASYESGTRLYTRNLLKLARVLGVMPLWLETGRGPITPLALKEPSKNYQVSYWPFSNIAQDEYEQLNDQQQTLVENVVRTLISSLSNTKG